MNRSISSRPELLLGLHGEIEQVELGVSSGDAAARTRRVTPTLRWTS